MTWTYAGFIKGANTFWGFGQVAFRKAACGACHSHALVREVRGHAPPRIFLNGAIWCALEHIFIIFSLKSNSINLFFYTKIMINCSHVLASRFRMYHKSY